MVKQTLWQDSDLDNYQVPFAHKQDKEHFDVFMSQDEYEAVEEYKKQDKGSDTNKEETLDSPFLKK